MPQWTYDIRSRAETAEVLRTTSGPRIDPESQNRVVHPELSKAVCALDYSWPNMVARTILVPVCPICPLPNIRI